MWPFGSKKAVKKVEQVRAPLLQPPGYFIDYIEAVPFTQGSLDMAYASGGLPIVARDGAGQVVQGNGFDIAQGGVYQGKQIATMPMPTIGSPKGTGPLAYVPGISGAQYDPRRRQAL